jgi:hypothetical protein
VLALVALVLVCCFSSGLGASIKINNDNVGKFLRPFASSTNFTELGKEMLAIMNTTVDPCTGAPTPTTHSTLSSKNPRLQTHVSSHPRAPWQTSTSTRAGTGCPPSRCPRTPPALRSPPTRWTRRIF